MKQSQSFVGKKFGSGIVIEQCKKPPHLKRGGKYWVVRCKCGNTSIVDTSTLKKRWKTCGCPENLLEKRFHKGIVISFKENIKGRRIWNLKCDCGNFYFARTESLKSGNTKSCGCLNDRYGKIHHKYKGHEDLSGDYWSKLRRGAKIRSIAFEITIEQAWAKFETQSKRCALTNWEINLSSSYIKGGQTASLDRIDSKKGYVADNIQWVHKDVNRMKQNYSESYLISICEAITKNRGQH